MPKQSSLPGLGNLATLHASGYALGLGNMLKTISLMRLLEMLNYELQKENTKTQGETAKAMGDATEESYKDQAEATKRSGIANITQGSIGAGATFGGTYLGPKYTGSGKALEESQAELKMANSWDDKLASLDESKAGISKDGSLAVENNQVADLSDEAITAKLKNAEIEKGYDKEFDSHLEAAKLSKNSETIDAYDNFKSRVRENQKTAKTRHERATQRKEETQRDYAMLGNQFGSVGHGIATMTSAEKTADAAEAENKKAQFSYAQEVARQTAQSTAQAIGDEKNGEQQATQIMGEIAAANHRA